MGLPLRFVELEPHSPCFLFTAPSRRLSSGPPVWHPNWQQLGYQIGYQIGHQLLHIITAIWDCPTFLWETFKSPAVQVAPFLDKLYYCLVGLPKKEISASVDRQTNHHRKIIGAIASSFSGRASVDMFNLQFPFFTYFQRFLSSEERMQVVSFSIMSCFQRFQTVSGNSLCQVPFCLQTSWCFQHWWGDKIDDFLPDLPSFNQTWRAGG